MGTEDRAVLEAADTKRAALFEADIFLERHSEREELVEVMDELCASLKKEVLHEQYRETVSALRAAEVAHDSAKTDTLMQDLARLAESLR
jgi:hypothetical protein